MSAGYSQGAQIGSPSRNRWREQGTGRTYLPSPARTVACRRNGHDSPCSRSIPSPSNTNGDGSAGGARRHRSHPPGPFPGCRRATPTTNSSTPFHRLNPERRQHLTEQRMRQRRHPHLARQHRPKMLQSLAITPGTGKTHLLIGLGTAAAEAGYRVEVHAGLQAGQRARRSRRRPAAVPHHRPLRPSRSSLRGRTWLSSLDRRGAELLFEVLTEREERASIAIASNEPFSSGPRPSPTPDSAPRSSTGSPTTARSSRPAPHSYRLAHARANRAKIKTTP